MTHDEQQQRAFFNRTPLSFLGMSFAKAMSVPSIRIAITCGPRTASAPLAAQHRIKHH